MGRTFYTTRVKLDKLKSEDKIDLFLDLIYSFGTVTKPDETALFLQDLLTANELRNLSIRLRVAKLLLAGYTYQEIKDMLHSSNTTITKVSVWLEVGGKGFRNVISKLPIKWDKPKKLPPGPIEFHLPELLLAIAQYKLSVKDLKIAEKLTEKVGDKKILDRSLQTYNSVQENPALQGGDELNSDMSSSLRKPRPLGRGGCH